MDFIHNNFPLKFQRPLNYKTLTSAQKRKRKEKKKIKKTGLEQGTLFARNSHDVTNDTDGEIQSFITCQEIATVSTEERDKERGTATQPTSTVKIVCCINRSVNYFKKHL
jgi:hypothetical protein